MTDSSTFELVGGDDEAKLSGTDDVLASWELVVESSDCVIDPGFELPPAEVLEDDTVLRRYV